MIIVKNGVGFTLKTRYCFSPITPNSKFILGCGKHAKGKEAVRRLVLLQLIESASKISQDLRQQVWVQF